MNQTKKHTAGKKFLALLLALIMTVSLLPVSVFATEPDAESVAAEEEIIGLTGGESGEPAADPEGGTETPVEEPAEEPVENPVEEPAENPVEEPVETPIEEPVEAPVEDPVDTQALENGLAVQTEDGLLATVVACSDFQNRSGDEEGAAFVKSVLKNMKSAGINAKGFLCAGDYSFGYSEDSNTLQGHITALNNAVASVYPNISHHVYVQGNHDKVTQGTGGLSGPGAHDVDQYGVFVIDEDDYMWYNNDQTRIQQTADNLKAYLDDKAAEGYNKPIFVVSHLPLHYSMRTKNDGDGMHANLIFNVLNAAGAKGLNIIFMYGHDHSNGWDDYLGGSCVYLAKGDNINIAQGSKTTFKTETLNFTYLNAGFVGYYENHNGADDTLTMTAFQIYSDKVVVSRYSESKEHNLKCKGVSNNYKDESGYSPDMSVVASPQTIDLTTVTPAPVLTINGAPVSGTCKVDMAQETTFTITLRNFDGYTVKWSSSKPTVATVDNNGTVTLLKAGTTIITATGTLAARAAGDTVTASVTLTVADSSAASTERIYTRVTSTEQLVSGKQYLLIYNSDTDYFMLPTVKTKSNNSGSRTGFDILQTTVAGPDTITGTDYIDYEWTLTESGSGWKLSAAGGEAKLTSTTDQVTATFSTSGDTFTIGGSADNFTFTSGGYALNYNSRGVINGYDSNPAPFYIYMLTSEGTSTEPENPTTASKTIYMFVGQTKTDTISGESVNDVSKNDIVDVTAEGTSSSVTVYKRGAKVESLTALESGKKYVIQSNRSNNYLTNETTGNMLATKAFAEDSIDSSAVWTITGEVNKKQTKFTGTVKDVNGGSLTFGDGSASTDGTKDLTLAYSSTWTMKRGDYYLNDYGNKGTQAGGYDSQSDLGSQWNIYEVVEATSTKASTKVTFTAKAEGTATVKVGNVTYTVIVRDKAQMNDYPEYPNEGSVRVSKKGSGVNFTETGVAKIELSTTGVPMTKGVDVILMLDTSSSMGNAANGSSKSRIDVLRESVANMLNSFNTPDATTGATPDIRVAIADFNGYYYSDNAVALADTDHLTDGSIRSDIPSKAQVYTGTYDYTAGAFVDASAYNTPESRTALVGAFKIASGTNYDAAFYYSYQLGSAIQVANSAAKEDRDLYVVFMSDGAPFQYNGFSSQSDQYAWNNWLTGTANNAASDSNSQFYNRDGQNWWAEAVKGDTGSMYTVIDKTSADNDNGNRYMKQVSGLGAKMYAIGFCLADDNQIKEETMQTVLGRIATDSSYYHKADTADALDDAFTQIASNIKKAGYDAVFTDVMGDAYTLQIEQFNTKQDKTGETIFPTITVSTYPLYKKSEVDKTIDGVTVTEAMVGTRKNNVPSLQETVTFAADGTAAYSDKIDNGGTSILADNKITAKLFTYDFTTETFSWNVGDITEDEQVLSYYVYLTGSMEGKRGAGSYPTNKSAVLTYKNWLDHDAKKDTTSPVMPWKSANVSYAFYLVNEKGEPIVNQTTGATGSFVNAVEVTQPVVYSEVLLNSETDVEASVLARAALPVGYTLYDAAAAYMVEIRSDGTGSWQITKDDTLPATTYVDQYDPNDMSASSNELDSANVNEGKNSYTNTIVWFAVKYKISAVPDAVVIDFGLPVDISVLGNDILGENAAVKGLAKSVPAAAAGGTTELADGFGAEYTGDYGDATIVGNKVRYTPRNMQMNGMEKFAYAAQAGTDNDQKYYYSTVTVIPAANIYYEDSFVTFSDGWERIGDEPNGITQQEDRPGKFSLNAYDANNVYGYDSAYTTCAAYSLGSAKKVTVRKETNEDPPTAAFTFTGTGFDLISLTSNTTGTILVDVDGTTKSSGEKVTKHWIVDTFYGYTRTQDGYIQYTWTKGADSKWHVTTEKIDMLPAGEKLGGTPVNDGDVTYEINYNWTVTPDSNNALYQIPVIRGQGLEYGTYKVTITPKYSSARDHANKGSYDFYLDAVRVYDPAGPNPEGEIGDAYKADGEGWPNVIELRNLLIDAKTLSVDTAAAAGIVFIDGNAAADLTDYTNYGPNNEVYLAAGQAIAFKLSADPSKIASIQLAAKAPKGAAIAQVNGGTKTDIATATEMYYTITHRVTWDDKSNTSNTIVVANTGNNILSLTNLKITYKEAPTSEPVTQVDAQVMEEAPAMLLSMLGIEAPAPEPDPEPFVPERFEASWNRGTVKAGQKATLTVKTSEDVNAITVNGETVTAYRTRTQRTGWGWNAKKVTYREFTYTITANKTAEYTIAAVNAEGVASEPVVNTLTVQAAAQRPGWGGWLGSLFGRWF